MPVLRGTKAQMGLAVRALMFQSMNGTGHLGYHTASNPKDNTVSAPTLVGHGFMAFGFAWVKSIDIKMVLI